MPCHYLIVLNAGGFMSLNTCIGRTEEVTTPFGAMVCRNSFTVECRIALQFFPDTWSSKLVPQMIVD